MKKSLTAKYLQSGPRYTSYPPIPYWNNSPNEQQWLNIVNTSVNRTNELSIYIHLPFCEELCTYCGCNKFITKRHEVEEDYVKALQQEFEKYKTVVPKGTELKQLHLGGGTPTYFSSENLQKILSPILSYLATNNDSELSIEIHPNYTNENQLRTLYKLGFNRISIGVQDFDDKVQVAINRKQSFEHTQEITSLARSIGFTSFNFDIIYGLPFQSEESIKQTIKATLSLNPDRIAYYGYAHVPWKSKAQRLYSEKDLPNTEDRIQLFQTGKAIIESKGFTPIGIDHFAKPEDELAQAFKNGTLHRNFMGYTTSPGECLIGLGCSSISEVNDTYVQNEKNWRKYCDSIKKENSTIIKGHSLNTAESKVKKHITDLLCHFKSDTKINIQNFELLNELIKDGLVEYQGGSTVITQEGKLFARNICLAFDPYISNTKLKEEKKFSTTI